MKIHCTHFKKEKRVFLNCMCLIFRYCVSFYVAIECICDNYKENWEPGDEVINLGRAVLAETYYTVAVL